MKTIKTVQKILRLKTILLYGILILLAGCHSIRRGEPIAGTFRTDDPAVERGQLVFSKTCSACHPGGEGGLGPALNDKVFPRFLMKTQVRLGLGAMPSFNHQRLSGEELDDLMKYVLAKRRQQITP
jgi:mono/diheme cytochrome c family protein